MNKHRLSIAVGLLTALWCGAFWHQPLFAKQFNTFVPQSVQMIRVLPKYPYIDTVAVTGNTNYNFAYFPSDDLVYFMKINQWQKRPPLAAIARFSEADFFITLKTDTAQIWRKQNRRLVKLRESPIAADTLTSASSVSAWLLGQMNYQGVVVDATDDYYDVYTFLPVPSITKYAIALRDSADNALLDPNQRPQVAAILERTQAQTTIVRYRSYLVTQPIVVGTKVLIISTNAPNTSAAPAGALPPPSP